MSRDHTRDRIEKRLAQGKPVGRLIDDMRHQGGSTAEYQPRRTTGDLRAHCSWASNTGRDCSEEAEEYLRR